MKFSATVSSVTIGFIRLRMSQWLEKRTTYLDYNNERVLLNFRRELQRPEMKNNSAIIFNFGLHFLESINFTSYKKLIDGVGNELDRKYSEIIQWNSTRSRRNRGKAIWKTTTAINKERASNIHLWKQEIFDATGEEYSMVKWDRLFGLFWL